MRRFLALVSVLVALVAGCSGGGEPIPTPSSSAPTTASSSPSPANPTPPPPSPSATASGSVKVGESISSEFFTATVEEVKLDQSDSVGGTFAGVMVKNCITKMPPGNDVIQFSWGPWALVGPDGSRYPNAGMSGGGLPQPTYPNGELDGSYRVGDCVRGWIFFSPPTGSAIQSVRYQPQNAEAWTWAL